MPSLIAMTVGDTPLDSWTLTLPDGQTPASLSDLAQGGLKVFFHNGQLEEPMQGQGTITVLDAPGGVITYQWAPADTAQAGTYQIAVQANFQNGQQVTFGVLNQVKQIIIAP